MFLYLILFHYLQSWTPPFSRLSYVISGVVFQYLVPLCIVTIAYIMVANSFHASSTKMFSNGVPSRRTLRKIKRRRRTDILLTVISLIFFLSWAPLNVLNVVISIVNPFKVLNSWFVILFPVEFKVSFISFSDWRNLDHSIWYFSHYWYEFCCLQPSFVWIFKQEF